VFANWFVGIQLAYRGGTFHSRASPNRVVCGGWIESRLRPLTGGLLKVTSAIVRVSMPDGCTTAIRKGTRPQAGPGRGGIPLCPLIPCHRLDFGGAGGLVCHSNAGSLFVGGPDREPRLLCAGASNRDWARRSSDHALVETDALQVSPVACSNVIVERDTKVHGQGWSRLPGMVVPSPF
jgi:hypothetical protein